MPSELQHARKGRLCLNRLRRRLQDACLRIRLHDLHHAHERLRLHHAVGVQHDHVAVTLAPAAAEVTDVAALSVQRDVAFAVKNAPEPLELLAQVDPTDLLLDPLVRVSGIAEDKEVEPVESTHAGQRQIH